MRCVAYPDWRHRNKHVVFVVGIVERARRADGVENYVEVFAGCGDKHVNDRSIVTLETQRWSLRWAVREHAKEVRQCVRD